MRTKSAWKKPPEDRRKKINENRAIRVFVNNRFEN